jgi:PAS domain S-box-containing protein
MNNSQNKTNSIVILRKKVENLLKANSSESEFVLPKLETLKLLHEIEVQQLELETQNEELLLTQLATQNAEHLYDYVSNGYFTLSSVGEIIDISLGAVNLLKEEKAKLIGRMFAFFVTDETKPIFINFLQNIFKNRIKESCEITLSIPGNKQIYVCLTGAVKKCEDKCHVTIIDVSDKKHFEVTLQNENDLYQDLINNQPAGIYRIRVFPKDKWKNDAWKNSENPPYRMELASDRFCEILGISRQNFEANPAIISDLIHPQDITEFTLKNVEANAKLIPFQWDGRLLIHDKIVWVHLESIPRPVANGEVLWTGILYDITNQKHDEEALKESEAKFRNIFEYSVVGKLMMNMDGKMHVNKAFSEIVGYSEEELNQLKWQDITYEDDIEFQKNEIEIILKGVKKFSNFQSRFVHKNGDIVWVDISTVLQIDDDGNPLYFITTVNDITAKKLAEKELNESEERFRAITEQTNDLISFFDSDGVVIYVSTACQQLFGMQPEEMCGRHFVDFLDDSVKVKANYLFKESLESGKDLINVELTLKRKDGSIFIGELSGTSFNQNKQISTLVILRDITERKLADEALLVSEMKYRSIFENVQDVFYETTLDGTIIEVSPSIEFVSKGLYQRTDLLGKSMHNYYINVDDRDAIIATLQYAGRINDYQVLFKNKDGSCIYCSITASLSLNAEGKKEKIVGVLHNNTDRIQAEEALRESEERYKTISENSNSAIFIMNEFSKIEWANQNLLIYSGYSIDQILEADSFVKFVAPEYMEFASSNFQKIISGKEYIHQYQLSVIRSDGNKRVCDKYITHFIDRYGKLKVIVILTDITERHKAENALKESKNLLNKLLYASTDFINSGSDGIIYSKLTDTILEISGAKYATFNLLDQNELEYTTVAISGLSEGLLKIRDVFGYELVNKKWKYDALNAKRIKNNVITKFDTIHDLAENVLSNTFATFVERTFHIGETFVVKILKNDKMIGDFTLLFSKGNTLQNFEILELFASQTGLYIDRENADKALRISEEKFRSITEQISDCISICDNNGIIYYVSPASKSMFQYESEEMLGRRLMEFIDDESLPKAMIALRVGIQDKRKNVNVELKLKRKDGSTFFAELNGTNVLFGHEERILVIAHDITERKKTVDALRASEDKYRTMIENSNDLIWMLDLHGNFTFVNEMSINTTGFIPEKWIGKSFVPLVSPEDLPMVKDVFQKSVAGESCNYELQLKKADESILTMSVNTSPIYVDGNVKGTVSFGRNITDRKLAEEALRESEELYRNLVQRIPDGVYKSTNDGKFVDVNPAMVQMLGYDSKEEMLAIDIKSQLYFDVADREGSMLKNVHEEVDVFQLRKKDGTGIWIEDHGWYNVDENGNVLFHEGILRDITGRKLAEQALEEKMEQLLRFHKLTVDRELTMIELKKEINRMLINAGQPEKYRIVE